MDQHAQPGNVRPPEGGRQRPAQVPPEGPAQHCRNALQLLDELQRRLLDDPTYGALPLHESLRLLAGARGRIWRAVWACEKRQSRRSP